MTARNSNFSGLLYYNPGSQGFNPVDSASLIPDTTSINEGAPLNVKVITWNIAGSGTLYWRVANLVNLTNNRFDNTSGYVNIDNNFGSFQIYVNENNSTAVGSQTYDIIVSKTNNGPALATYIGVVVNDTSQDPAILALDLDARNYLPANVSNVTVTVTSSNIYASDGLGNAGSLFRYNGDIPTQPQAGDTFIWDNVTYTITQVYGAEVYGTSYQYYAVFFSPALAPENTIPVSYPIDIAHGPTGLVWPDASGNSHPGSFVTPPSFTADSGAGFGNYITFNGTSDYTVIPTLQNSTYKSVTMSIWANAVDIASTQTLMSKELAYKMRLSNNGSTVYLNTLAGWSGSSWLSSGGPSGIPVGGWHHYAVTISPTSITTYVDGVSVGSASGIGTLPANTAAFMIGSYGDAGPGADFFIGKIGVARLYTYALTGTEVSDYYNLTKSRYQTVTSLSVYVDGWNQVNSWILPDIAGNPDLTQIVTSWTITGPNGYSATVTGNAQIPTNNTINWVIPVSVAPTETGTYTFTAP